MTLEEIKEAIKKRTTVYYVTRNGSHLDIISATPAAYQYLDDRLIVGIYSKSGLCTAIDAKQLDQDYVEVIRKSKLASDTFSTLRHLALAAIGNR